METIQDAKATLEAEGLFVAMNSPISLLIGGSVADGSDGLRVYKDASGLNQRNGEWVAILPADGLLQYEVPGSLAQSVSLILAAYQEHHATGDAFKDACKRVLGNADRYLIGRSLAGV